MNYSMKKETVDAFNRAYGTTLGLRCFFAPGRVNLIGEHTDYNGGHVLPFALNIGTYAAVRSRSDDICRFYSINFKEEGVIESKISDIKYNENKSFANYPLGVIDTLLKSGYKINHGFDVAFYGDIPYCSGLSSSASVEVLTAYICKVIFGLDINSITLAKLCQKAENEFVGVNCGIMDQFASAMGKAEHAIFLDTNTLEYEYIPLKTGNYKFVIACTNKKRELQESKYNERRSECEQAVSQISDVCGISALGELSAADFEKVCGCINDFAVMKRARHAVYENLRTVKACELLKANDLVGFGALMNESHASLKSDYEVTGLELDTLVEAAREQEGVLGARMTGAGFGGCTINLVEENCIDKFILNVGKIYEEKVGYKADFYPVEAGRGPREI